MPFRQDEAIYNADGSALLLKLWFSFVFLKFNFIDFVLHLPLKKEKSLHFIYTHLIRQLD